MTAIARTSKPAATSPAVPRWAHWAAHAIPLTVLPSSLWRLALGLGAPMGFSGHLARVYEGPGWVITPYVIALSLVSEGAAALALGLVRPWGERAPHWIPFIGGRRVHVLAAVIPALLGAITVTVFILQTTLHWTSAQTLGNSEAPQGAARLLMNICYAPLLAWGPLLFAVTIAYAVRRGACHISAPRSVSGV